MPPAEPAALQEQIPLEGGDGFVFRADLEDLGVDPSLIERLVEAGPLCFLDFEATGLEPGTDALIDAGAVLVEPGRRDALVFNTLIHTDLELSPFIRRLTGIFPDHLTDAPQLTEVAAALDRFIGDAPIVAHNAAFERSFLDINVNRRFGDHTYLDTFDLLGVVYPDSPNMKLDTFCVSKLGRAERHRALDDALDTLRIVTAIFGEARDGEPGAANAREALARFEPTSTWLDRLAALPSPERTRTVTVSSERLGDDIHLDPVPLDREAIAARLGDVDLVRRVLPDFETREPQIRLMEHVFDCFTAKDGKSIALGEAGTGVGKTLAYLAVAIPFARTTGEPVVVSTSGKVLQTQLLEKDLPAAARILGYPDLRFTVMKGRANYICRRRMDAFLEERAAPPSSYAAALLAAFDHNTAHGEVDRLPSVHVQRNEQLDRYLREVTSAQASECRRQECETAGGECVFRDARRRLDGAEIAVVNHDLLLRWPPDYPPLRHLILDEVHELVEKCDGAFARVADAVDLRHRLESFDEQADVGDAATPLVRHALALLPQIGREARRVSRDTRDNRFQFGRDELLVPLDGPGAAWKELSDANADLAHTLGELARALAKDEAGDDDDGPRSSLAEHAADASWVLGTALAERPGDQYVFRWRGLSRPGDTTWRVVATPVSPAADFEMHVLDKVETLFGTSATVAVGGERIGAVRELELDERAAGKLVTHDPVDSPFDYEKNLEVLFLSDRTDNARLVDRTAEAAATLASSLGGRTLVLFTSRDRMIKVANILEQRLAPEGIGVIAPTAGNADPHELVRSFLASPRSVLLGARSFWQGVDLAGDACRAVVIEKLPFDVPGDPLLDRRASIIEADGGNPFFDYTIPRMLLRLKQMMGRLIRTPTDSGLIVLVESRSDKRYFRRLIDAVPPDARTRKVPLAELGGEVEAFVRLRLGGDAD